MDQGDFRYHYNRRSRTHIENDGPRRMKWKWGVPRGSLFSRQSIKKVASRRRRVFKRGKKVNVKGGIHPFPAGAAESPAFSEQEGSRGSSRNDGGLGPWVWKKVTKEEGVT
jgi:hypothetical protein